MAGAQEFEKALDRSDTSVGRLLADRALSRLLGKDFPRTLEDLEALRRRA